MSKDVKREVNVLSFEKKIAPSNGCFFGTTWEKRTESKRALPVTEKSVRGTISNALKDAVLNDPMKLSAEIQKANPQTVDCCFLSSDEDTLVTSFTVKFLGGIENPSACSNPDFLNNFRDILGAYKKEHGFHELAFRYAYNLACGRFLWRNRMGAENIEVAIRDGRDDAEWTFNAKQYPLRKFDESRRAELQPLADRIADALMGDDFVLFDVVCYAKVGRGQEVYPSEEMILDKEKGDKDKSKVLYSVDGSAAFHSQKIGNAIRTIDTWYKDYGTDKGVGPIAVDAYGPVTTLSKAFRSERLTDFYSIMDKYVWEKDLERAEDKYFFMAMIVRGGVFGKSSKE